MDPLTRLAEIYDKIGILGFMAVMLSFVVIFLLFQQAQITKRFFQSLDQLAKENKRLNDALIGLSAFIQSFLSVIAEYEEAMDVINRKIKCRQAGNAPSKDNPENPSQSS